MLNVVVTGASRGLGLAIAEKLASSGFRVIAVARQESQAFSASAQQANAVVGDALQLRAFDLTNLAEIPAFTSRLSQEFGPIYGLVNNAGLGTSGILATMLDSRLEALIRLNVTAPIMLTKYAVRSMMVGGSGRIVNISSVVVATGYSGLSAYSASKAALAGLTRPLARELGPLGITVNNVAPGFLATEMTKDMDGVQLDQIVRRSALRRLAEVDEVANVVDYLFSDKARSVTGTTITIDAGNTA